MKRLLVLVPLALAALVAPSFSHADAAPTNLALGAVATASSQENDANPPSNAIDGDATTTRWSSAFSDPQTIQLDLGARASISEIKLTWEAAYGKAYSIDVSDDGTNWTPVTSTTSGDGGVDDYPNLSVSGRYVRMVGTQRATAFGYSLYEFEVDGTFLQTAVSLGASSYQIPEKNGSADIPVTLNQAATSPVTVDYATSDGTATAGKDYVATSGTLTFAPGETSKTVHVQSIDDAVDEPNETFNLSLSNASGGVVIGPRAGATVTVQDDDETPFSGKVLNVRDFEGTLNVLPNPINNVGFFTFSNAAASTPTITTVNDPRPGSAGTQAMHLVANVTSGGYGGFSDDFAQSQDWTAYDGFSFWFKGTNTGKSIEFEIKDGGTDGEHGELWNSHVTDDSTQWKLVRVPFSSFARRTDFQPGGAPTDGKLNLTNMWGWAMNLPGGAHSDYELDDVQVYQQVVTIDDYESGGTPASHGITTFNGSNAPPTLAFEAQPRDDAPSNHALRVDYNTPASGFGGFQQDFTDPQDWSAFKGFRFWFFGRDHGAAPVKINLEIKDGGTGPGASELWTTSFLDDTVGWHLVEIPFKQFTYRTDFQPVGGINHVLDLTKMWGYAVTPPTSSGSFDWDDVQVYGVAGAAADTSVATDKPVYLAHEGDTVNVGVQLTTRDGQPSKAPVDVTYATSGGTATPIDDYTPASGTLTFPAGTASGAVQTFPVSVLTDAAAEQAETIGIQLTSTSADVPTTAASIVIDANGLPYLNASLPVEQRIDDLMSRMSEADKIGQMTEVERGAFTNPADIATYRLGSILSGGGSVPASNTPQGWADMIDGFQTQAMATPLQIPLIYGADEVHGHNNVYGATLFPHNTGMGATRDPALAQQEGEVTAAESKATGVPWAFAPCLCVSRDERWGRSYESFGEDPALVQKMETFITGLQGGGVLATAKHFVGDGDTTYGTGSGSYKIDQGITQVTRAHLQQIDLPPFDTAVKLGVGSVMPSYSSLVYTDDPNDKTTKMHARGDLITGWLKQQEGFDGFVISDYAAIDQIGSDYTQDVKISINAGLDMIMVPFNYTTFQTALQTELANGDIAQSRVDDAVRRILREKFRLGLFEHPFADRSGTSDFGSAAHRAVARKAAAESQVLLKNDGVLPLSKSAHVYVAGANADDLGNQAGGWTISWQGGSGTPTVGTTILAGMKQVAPGATFTYSKDASAPMAGNDVGVVVVGETPYAEGQGDIGVNGHTFALSAADQTAISRVCGAMKCVVLLVSGRPLPIGPQLAQANAFVASWLPGTEGEGVADTLFGDTPFTGRLPVTWPRSEAQLPINVGDASYDPQFPFGWGLRTDSAKARLQSVRGSLSGDALTQLDALLAADDWNADGSVKNAGDVLARLASLAGAIGDQPFAVQDTIVSVARDIAQAAMLKRGIAAGDSTLTADAEHAVLSGDPVTAVRKFAAAANVSVSTTGGAGGTVPATLALTLGTPASFGTFTPGVAHTYTASTTADVVSTAGDATLSVSDPDAAHPGHLVNGAFFLPSPLQVDIAPASWSGPVSHGASAITFTQPIGANDALRTGTYAKTLTFTLSTTNP